MPMPRILHRYGSSFNKGEFQGIYPSLGLEPGPINYPLLFQVVSSQQPDYLGNPTELLYMIPENWMDNRCQFFLYPPPDFTVLGLPPWSWGLINYKRRRYPEQQFVEYDIMDIITENGPVSFEEAQHQLNEINLSLASSGTSGVLPSSESQINFETQDLFREDPDQANSYHSILDISQSRSSASFVTSSPNISKKSSSRKQTSGSTRFPTVAKRPITSTAATRSNKRNPSSSSPSQGLNNETMVSITAITRTPTEGRSSPAQVQPGSSSRSNTRHSPPLQAARVSKEKTTTALSVRTESPVANQIPLAVVVEKDVCTDKVEWRKEMLRQTLVTHALLRDLIPQKRLISKVLQTFLTRFTQKVEKEVKLPLNQFEEIEALNTALLDMELSVSLCAIQIDKLRLLKTELLICKSLFVSLLSAQLPHKIQWKKRGQDRRPGFGHLTNFVAVFGVVVMAILETHKKQTNISKIITAVQTARRFHAAQYQKYLNTDDEANDEDVGGEGERPRVDVQTISEIETRVNQILKSLEVYSDTQA